MRKMFVAIVAILMSAVVLTACSAREQLPKPIETLAVYEYEVQSPEPRPVDRLLLTEPGAKYHEVADFREHSTLRDDYTEIVMDTHMFDNSWSGLDSDSVRYKIVHGSWRSTFTGASVEMKTFPGDTSGWSPRGSLLFDDAVVNVVAYGKDQLGDTSNWPTTEYQGERYKWAVAIDAAIDSFGSGRDSNLLDRGYAAATDREAVFIVLLDSERDTYAPTVAG